jgi:hypothetical protein
MVVGGSNGYENNPRCGFIYMAKNYKKQGGMKNV